MLSRSLGMLSATCAVLIVVGCGDAGSSSSVNGSPESTFTTVEPGYPSALATPAKLVGRNARSSILVTGNSSPSLPSGSPGVIALISEAPQLNESDELPIVVRNNTAQAVERITASATIRGVSGKLIATGSDQGLMPNLVQPGDIAFGYIFFQNSNLRIPPGGKVSIQLGSTPASRDAYENIRALRVSDTNLTSGEFEKQVLGQAVDQYPYHISGPIEVYVACFNSHNRIVNLDSDFASPGDLKPKQMASYTVNLTTPHCPVYLVAASGFTS